MRFDLHTHTYYSRDAVSTPEDMVKAARSRGIGGIAVTDHNTARGWKRAVAAGRKHGVVVIKAEEVQVFHVEEMIGEVLALFIDTEIAPGEFSAVADAVKAQGGLLIVAHPFDRFRNAFTMLKEYKKRFDGVEAFNARVLSSDYNVKAARFAKENAFAVTGGSDGHCSLEVGHGWTEADGAGDAEALMKAIRQKKTVAAGKKTNPFIHVLSPVANAGVVGRVKER